MDATLREFFHQPPPRQVPAVVARLAESFSRRGRGSVVLLRGAGVLELILSGVAVAADTPQPELALLIGFIFAAASW